MPASSSARRSRAWKAAATRSSRRARRANAGVPSRPRDRLRVRRGFAPKGAHVHHRRWHKSAADVAPRAATRSAGNAPAPGSGNDRDEPEEQFEKTFRLVCRLDDADIDYVRDTAEWIRRCVGRVLALNPSATRQRRHADRRRHEHPRPLAPDASGERSASSSRCRLRRHRANESAPRGIAALLRRRAARRAVRRRPAAASQLYKCVDGGRTVYQQQACSVSSQPEAAASAPRTWRRRRARRPPTSASSAPRKIRPSFACFIRARHAPMRTSRPGSGSRPR